jgi:hypothetical protein
MPVDVSEVLLHAQPTAEEAAAFAAFLQAVRDALLLRKVPRDPEPWRLGDYLDAVGPAPRSGDEADVVDAFMRLFLGALGYGEADVSYNRRLDDDEERAVPDFTVRLSDLLGTIPVFLVEDKATDVRDFTRPRPGHGGRSESPLQQLRRYVVGGAVHARVGLLFNGFTMEAWQFDGDGEVRLAAVDVHDLARSAQAGPYPGAQGPALRTLFDRFSRVAFTSTWDLASRATRVPHMPREWLSRMSEALQADGAAGVDRVRDEYYEFLWKARAIDVSAHPGRLVDALRGLIERFAGDVAVQVREALARAARFDAAAAKTDDRSRLSARLAEVAGYRPYFPAGEFDGLLMQPIADWCRQPAMEDLRARARTWVAALEPHLHEVEATSEQQALPEVPTRARGRAAAAGGFAPRSRILDKLATLVEGVCNEALSLYGVRSALEAEFTASLRVARAFDAWSRRVSSTVLVGAPLDRLMDEFARQTAYVYVIRLLLVRICEDKGLFRRKLSDGGLVNWQDRAAQYLDYASGRSYEYLTRMAYECAQNVYAHFYGASGLFDWYRMDDKVLMRGLVVLDCFDLARIDTDIIGTVYGRYLDEAKHEQGRFYTPRPLVVEMMDRLGWKAGAVGGRRIGDLACGSGSFLVEACRRLLDAFRGPDGRIPAASLEPALREVQRSIFGIDLNPFACYLAETNLLIQVLDLIREGRDAGANMWVDRFEIYCADALLAPESADVLRDREQATPELAKARAGAFAEGFDFLIGNPPYVRADEAAPRWLDYRRRVEAEPWFTTRHQKWDLYVPFVEQYLRLLSDSPGSRACLVTIESIQNSPYAAPLRELLARRTTVHDVLFLEKLRLFKDAPWQSNAVFSFSRGAPPPDHRTRRSVCRTRAADGALRPEALDQPVQAACDPDRLFNPRDAVRLDLSDTVRWEDLAYVTVGMVLNSDEKLVQDGVAKVVTVPAGYDPARFGEDLVEDLGPHGKRVRHKPFTRDELVADVRDDVHTRPTVGSEEVLRGGIGRVEWLEYGEHTRCPAFVRRPEIPGLFDRPKVMFGAFTGVAVDDAAEGRALVVPHTVRITIRWCLLADLQYGPVRKDRERLVRERGLDPARSADVSDDYLCAIALSEPIQKWLWANKRSMKDDVYPLDIRAIPVKLLSPEAQRPFVDLARERHRLWAELAALEADGCRTGDRVEVPVRRLAERFRADHPEHEHLSLFLASVRGLFRVAEAWVGRDLTRARAAGAAIRIGRETVAEAGPAVADRDGVARTLARLLAALPGTFADAQTRDLVPADEAGLLALGAFLDAEEAGVRRRKDRIAAIGAEIDALAWDLYRPREGAPAEVPPPVRGVREGPLL